MKPEIDYIVERDASNAIIIKKKYINDRPKMLEENPTVNKKNFVVIEDDHTFCRYNEINGAKMIWVNEPYELEINTTIK